jgi:hypothetical protein
MTDHGPTERRPCYLKRRRASLLVETMMNSPNCPEHGRLVLDLAQGRLDDAAAERAELVSESCPVCAAWWREQFEGSDAAVIDRAVAGVIDDLRLPTRRRRRGWMAAAAAIVMSLGVGTIWVSQRGATIDEVPPPKTASIQALDFESQRAVGVAEVVDVLNFEGLVGNPAVDLQGVRLKIEDHELRVVDGADQESREAGEELFSGGFDSGDLGSWVPTT